MTDLPPLYVDEMFWPASIVAAEGHTTTGHPMVCVYFSDGVTDRAVGLTHDQARQLSDLLSRLDSNARHRPDGRPEALLCEAPQSCG